MKPGWLKRSAVALVVDMLGAAVLAMLSHVIPVRTWTVFVFGGVFVVVFVPWIVEGAWLWNLKRGSE